MGYMEVTELLQEKLLLELPPVALSFVDEPPPDVLVMGKESPSLCTFWRWGENAVFYASAEQHMGCLIGGMVAGFPLNPEQMDEIQHLVDELCPSDEVPRDNAADVPKVSKKASGIVYGPLWRFPLQPDVVLFWATMVQAAVMQEVTQPLMWRGNPQGAYFARPACSVLAIAMAHQHNAYSLGCVGMRAYTQIPSELGMLAVPGSQLEALEKGLATIEDPQARMQVYYDRIKAVQAAQAGD